MMHMAILGVLSLRLQVDSRRNFQRHIKHLVAFIKNDSNLHYLMPWYELPARELDSLNTNTLIKLNRNCRNLILRFGASGFNPKRAPSSKPLDSRSAHPICRKVNHERHWVAGPLTAVLYEA